MDKYNAARAGLKKLVAELGGAAPAAKLMEIHIRTLHYLLRGDTLRPRGDLALRIQKLSKRKVLFTSWYK